MNLKTYINDDHNDLFEDVYEEVVETNLGDLTINKSFNRFNNFMNHNSVIKLAEGIVANDFALYYFRRNIDEIEPERIIKYFYVHACKEILPLELDVVLFSQLSDEPDVRGNNLYLQDGTIKKLAFKYDTNFKTYTDDLD